MQSFLKTGGSMNYDSGTFLKEVLPKLRIAVIGDIMLDRYIFGKVDRISPEAPVPVNLVQSLRATLGGAANTVSNLASLGCRVYASGLVGDDENCRTVRNLFREGGIDDSGLIVRDGYETITKIRILGSRQQMLRLDFERISSLTEKEECGISDWFRKLCRDGLDAVVLSDYGKGVISFALAQQIIRQAGDCGIPVLADPKGSDWEKYTGADAVTPNLKELSDCWGSPTGNETDSIEKAGRMIREKFRLKHLIVTRSEKGITCISEDGTRNCPAMAQEVFDVSGAGDTVMAVLAASMAAGLDMDLTLRLANTAAGIVVAKVGTYPIHREELVAAWEKKTRPAGTADGPLSWDDAAERVRKWQSRGEKVVFTNGCFDLLHRGHVTYLRQAAALGDHLIIGLNSDSSVKQLKGQKRPIVGEMDRAFLLSSLRCVDGVVLFSEDTPAALLSLLRPDILVKGGDYRPEEVAGREFAGAVKILPFVDGYSTTDIVERIRSEKD